MALDEQTLCREEVFPIYQVVTVYLHFVEGTALKGLRHLPKVTELEFN